MVYLTGDTHGNFNRIEKFCRRFGTSKDDVLIILGDAGINYHGGIKDSNLKQELSELPITLFCIHGNHEERPNNRPSYELTERFGGTVYYEPRYPNLLFAKDGEVYEFNGKKCIAIGGAYSVDKFYRLQQGWGWFADEQPSDEIKKHVEGVLDAQKWHIDVVLSHTCPYKYIPREVFLKGIDQKTVDDSTEHWLDSIEDRLDYARWFCGHYHTDKSIDKMRFLSMSYVELTQGLMHYD